MDILGIRIGRTNTSAALVSIRDRRIEEIPLPPDLLFPSVVVYDNGAWLIGRDAKALSYKKHLEIAS
jgi:molecular chaperone DnaK (HSP70)